MWTRAWRIFIRARGFVIHGPGLQGRAGLEIGGPSAVFQAGEIFPIYALLSSLDYVDYKLHTAWSKDQQIQGQTSGQRWVAEARNLHQIEDGRYDCVLSSHMLEHSSNPVATLMEWRRVQKPGGMLVLVLPDPTQTFDHRRPITTMSHLVEDY